MGHRGERSVVSFAIHEIKFDEEMINENVDSNKVRGCIEIGDLAPVAIVDVRKYTKETFGNNFERGEDKFTRESLINGEFLGVGKDVVDIGVEVLDIFTS